MTPGAIRGSFYLVICPLSLVLGKRQATEDKQRMGYRNLQECVADLERSKQLIRIDAEVDPRLEIAEIQRRVYQAAGPALSSVAHRLPRTEDW